MSDTLFTQGYTPKAETRTDSRHTDAHYKPSYTLTADAHRHTQRQRHTLITDKQTHTGSIDTH